MASQPPQEIPTPGSEPATSDPGPSEIDMPGSDVDVPSPGTEPGTGDADPIGFARPSSAG